MIYDPPKSRSGSLKRSNPDSEELGDECVGRSDRLEGRKSMKRKGNERLITSLSS